MNKIAVILISIILAIPMCACAADEEVEIVENDIDVTPFVIEFEWDDEMIGDDYDIELVTDDDGSGYKLEKMKGKAVLEIENTNINFDLTYVWLPPVGTLNNLPKCEAKIYANEELKEIVSTDNTENIFTAPTGAAGFGICSAENGTLIEYDGEWKNFARK